jgi:hypothetical protein
MDVNLPNLGVTSYVQSYKENSTNKFELEFD